MKTLLTILFAAFLFAASGQKIKVSEVDRFNGFRRIETDHVTISMTWTVAIDIKIRSADSSIFLFLRGSQGVIGKDDEITFLLANGAKVTATSTGVQSNLLDGGLQYRITLDAIRQLASGEITDFRIEKTDSYSDNKVQNKFRPYVSKLFNVFLKEYEKSNKSS